MRRACRDRIHDEKAVGTEAVDVRHELVIARAAIGGVGTIECAEVIDDIIARAADDRIGPPTGVDRDAARRCRKIGVERIGVSVRRRDLFEIIENVGVAAAGDARGPGRVVRRVDGDGLARGQIGVIGDVRTSATIERVIARAAPDDVIAAIAIDRICCTVAIEQVGARATDDPADVDQIIDIGTCRDCYGCIARTVQRCREAARR